MWVNGENLKMARDTSGLADFTVAKEAGISLGQYREMEAGRKNMKRDIVERVARVLNVDVADIASMTANGPEKPEKPEEIKEPDKKAAEPEKIPKPEKVEPCEDDKVRGMFIKFFRRPSAEFNPAELIIRSDVITAISKDVRYPKIWVSYEDRGGIANFSECFESDEERDERWEDIMLALFEARNDYL